MTGSASGQGDWPSTSLARGPGEGLTRCPTIIAIVRTVAPPALRRETHGVR